MKAEEIFEKSVGVMKNLLSPRGVSAALQRARDRTQNENLALLLSEREHINELVRKVVDRKGSQQALEGASERLTDAMVIRYIRNRDVFMKTFPGGIEGADPDPVSLWAAIMISPGDEESG